MPMQARDYFYYRGLKYTLIDVEKGKQIIDYGRFRIRDVKYGYCSNCWRGYKAIYSVEKKQLFGIKYNCQSFGDNEVSKKVPVYYTGSCIIALDNSETKKSDQLTDFLDFESAYELHFTRGILNGVNDISEAIREFKGLDQTNENFLENCEQLSRKYLKYNYDYKTYKWRYEAAIKTEKELKKIFGVKSDDEH